MSAGAADKGRAVDGVYLDFNKAFDTLMKCPYHQTGEIHAG